MRNLAALLLALGIPATWACYSYQTVPLESVTEGAAVRARISQAQVEALRGATGNDGQLLQGSVLEASADALYLGIPVGSEEAGVLGRGVVNRIDLPFAEIEEIQVRRLSWLRTGLLVGVSTAVGAALVYDQFGSDTRGDNEGEDGGTEATLIPLFRIVF
jgi:hypothetical protein